MNINPTILIAIATFLWYRKGRLWNFYDLIIIKSIKQITTNSLDRQKWEEMARENCDKLGEDLFNCLFRFELEYLRDKIIDNQHTLWISDIESNGNKIKNYRDKEKFAIYELKNMFYNEFRCCGAYLFLKSIQYCFQKKKDQGDIGYTETSLKK